MIVVLDRKGGRERRAADRFRVNRPAMLQSAAKGIAAIRVLDVGRFGLRVTIPFRVPLNDQVEVRMEGVAVNGIVKSCDCKKAFEFHVGIDVGDSSLDHLPTLKRAISLNRHP